MVTFNVLHGRSLRDGRVDGDRYVEAVRALDADVLGLQEVDLAQPRSGHLDLAGLAAEAVGAGVGSGGVATYRFVAAINGTPGERFTAAAPGGSDGGSDGDGPCFGVALVSRLPVRSWHVTRLAAAPVRSPVYVPGPTGPLRLLRDEPRVVLAAVVDGPAGPVTVATTHLSFVPGWNVGQLRRVVRALRALPGPRLLLGDLNMPARLAGVVSGWRSLARLATYPTGRPRVQLDHVLAESPGRWRVLSADAPESSVSDHRPLVVDVESA
jgi:endonuclease/exonuclease/phosphatase family metal-dependent hydrolase